MEMDIKTGFAEVNGARLYYETAGAGHPLVLLHGFSLDTRMWNAQFETFAQHFRVIRYDIRGFGRSIGSPSDTVCHHEDLHLLLAYLEVEQSHVVGLSMGGAIAIDFALTHPAFISKLVLVDTNPKGWKWSSEMQAIFAIREIARKEDLATAKKTWLECPLFKPANEQPAVAKQLAQIIWDYTGLNWLHDVSEVGETTPAIERLNEIKEPTLIVVGEREVRDILEGAGVMAREIPDAQTVILPNVGHMSNMEDPQGFNTLVLRFLSDN